MRRFAPFVLVLTLAACSSGEASPSGGVVTITAQPAVTTTVTTTTTTTLRVATTTTAVPMPVTVPHISSSEALGALTGAFATLLPGYSPTAQDVALFQAQTLRGDDTELAAVGFVSTRYASTIRLLRNQAAGREQDHRFGCVNQTFDEMMSGTTAPSHDESC